MENKILTGYEASVLAMAAMYRHLPVKYRLLSMVDNPWVKRVIKDVFADTPKMEASLGLLKWAKNCRTIHAPQPLRNCKCGKQKRK